jgi:hypothetical protein
VLTLPSGLRFSGIDFAQYKDSDFAYDFSAMKQETIVNRGKRAPPLCCINASQTLPPVSSTLHYTGLKDLVVSAFINKHNNQQSSSSKAGAKCTSRL